MNFKNTAENLLIVIICTSLGGVIGYNASHIGNRQTIELLRPIIEQAIAKETSAITNEFKTEIAKLKSKKGSEATLVVTPQIDSELTSEITKNDTIEKEKRGIFKKIFGKRK